MTNWKCPSWLSKYAQQCWPDVVSELDRRGRMLLVQPAQVAMFCTALAEYRCATIQLNKEGSVAYEERGSEEQPYTILKVHPAFRVQESCIKQASQLIKELGLNEPLNQEDQTAVDGLAHWLDRARKGLPDSN